MLACIGGLKQLDSIDRRHWGLQVVPEEVYRHERTLEELSLDFNGIQELPPKFFRLTNLRKLTLCENDLNRISPGIAHLTRLVELDISKNAIEDVPTNMQFCRSLRFLDLSSNPLLRSPENVSCIGSLVHLSINDVGIPRLPLDIGNLGNLTVLEARENTLKTLPVSIAKLKKLERLDVGNNEIEFLPIEVGELEKLTELWVDTNSIAELPASIINLKYLTVLDVTKNRLERLPGNFTSLSKLSDLHLSFNQVEVLPEDLGRMMSLTLLKLDTNHLLALPDSIGQLDKVTELLLFDNMLEAVPSSLFEMKSLEMLNLDRNHLVEIPSTVGQCQTLHVLSLRENELCEMPEELGELKQLKVLDIIGNRIRCLPVSYSNLDLDAFWIDSSQPQPLVLLELKPDLDDPELKVLTCGFIPQRGPYNSSMENFLEDGSLSAEQPANSLPRTGSFGKGARLGVAFDPSAGPGPEEGSKLVRFPTPFRKDMKALKAKAKKKKGKYKPTATPSTTIFRKGSSCKDDFAGPTSLDHKIHELKGDGDGSPLTPLVATPEHKSQDSLGDFQDIVEKFGSPTTIDPKEKEQRSLPYDLALTNYEEEPFGAGILSKSSKMENLSREDVHRDLGDMEEDKLAEQDSGEVPNSVLRVIEMTIEIEKEPSQTLGFSIAGGRGSTPAYEDVDDSVYVTKVAPGGLAEDDGRIHLGDKLLSVNHISMVNATHAEAVAALKSVTTSCHLIISREVVVVLPSTIAEEEEMPLPGEEEEVPLPDMNGEEPGPVDANSGEPSGAGETGDDQIPRNQVKVTLQQIHDEDNPKLSRTTSPSAVSPSPTPPSSSSTSSRQHDNYINYDIAQIVVKEGRRGNVGEGPARSATPELQESPMHSAKKVEESNYHTRSASYSMSINDDEEEDYPIERVILDRRIGKLGLSIVGGADHVSRVFGQGKPGLYVSKISKGGAAAATKKLILGDRILEVNKFNVRYSTHQQAVQWLVSQDGDIELLIQHVPQPPGLMEVHLRKEKDQKLGLSIRGGGKESKGNPLDHNDEGIFISKIAGEGVIKQDGRLKVGMRIIEVNGTSLLGASHKDAVRSLRCFPDLHVTACDGFDPEEVIRMKAQEEAMEAERISSITESSHIPLSAASSMILDTAINGLLSESTDGLDLSPSRRAQTLKTKRSHSAVTPPYYSLGRSKMSQSYNALDDNPEVPDKDFDTLLDELAKFKIETSQQVEKLDAMTRRHSTPPPDLEPIPLSDIIGPLQSGGIETMDDNAFSLNITAQESPAEESFASELSMVEMKDTSSMLADIDSEVSFMNEEVSKGEDEMNKEQEVEDEETPKVKRRGTQRLKVPSEPEKPKIASPETRRRAEMINVPVMPDAKASEDAVKSIIGEVFSDISFEEFEKETTWSNRSSGLLRSFSPDSDREDMGDLVKALSSFGYEKKKTQSGSISQSSKASSSDSMEGPEPLFGKAPSAKERASTMPATRSADSGQADSTSFPSEVTLRGLAAPRDPTKRKSAPPVAEKPTHRPGGLTIKEKIELHEKATEGSESGSGSGSVMSLSSKSKSISAAPSIAPKPAQAPPTIQRTSSSGKTTPTSPTELLPFSERVAVFHGSQSNNGGARGSTLSDKAISAEEKRLARIVGADKVASSVDSAQASLHTDKDCTSSQPILLSNTNSNNNNNNNKRPSPIRHITVTSIARSNDKKNSSEAASKSKDNIPKTLL